MIMKNQRLKNLVLGGLRFFRLIHEPDLKKRYPQHKFGKGTYGNLMIRDYLGKDMVEVGAYTSIAPGVTILLGADHRPDWVTTFPFNEFYSEFGHIKGHPKSKGDVKIGNDVWLGLDAIILSGVTIGDGAVIGARALVTKDVPPYAIVSGIPAKIRHYRFSEKTITLLSQIKWWEWDDEQIRRAIPDLQNENIERFINKAITGFYL